MSEHHVGESLERPERSLHALPRRTTQPGIVPLDCITQATGCSLVARLLSTGCTLETTCWGAETGLDRTRSLALRSHGECANEESTRAEAVSVRETLTSIHRGVGEFFHHVWSLEDPESELRG